MLILLQLVSEELQDASHLVHDNGALHQYYSNCKGLSEQLTYVLTR